MTLFLKRLYSLEWQGVDAIMITRCRLRIASVWKRRKYLFILLREIENHAIGAWLKKLIVEGKSSDCSRVDLSAEISQTEDLSMKNNTYNDYLLPNVLAMRFSHFLYRSFSAILLLSCLQNL